MLAHSNNNNNFSSTFVLVHRSNQISFIGLVSSKDYYKRPGGVVYKKGHLGVQWEWLWEGVDYTLTCA